ncbi:hypothetical protein KQY27_06730 [Methanobrevibacter sp. TMH8]|uniref:DUF6364 family protein n=1 Tax=Methanobrevibacter sp. TMH8 TaxID=2848611 RepID=UPI001CCA8B5A|nr:DUF6364 family protein [Methanobrevibacter sp. TMH8]MBZ9571235.1 hypothetical protein [Methanobrevibacter sp. TMH8]
MKNENKIRTTLNLDKDVMKRIKVVALNKNTTQTEIINKYLKKGLESEKSVDKIPNYLIANNDTYNPDPEEIEKMAGMFITDKPFNAVKIVRKIRKGYL